MRVIIFLLLSLQLLPLPLQAAVNNDTLQLPIASYIVQERGSSKVLMAKDIDRPVSPASLTKILTCIMAIESGRLEDDVLITKESTMVEPSIAGFKTGEKIKLIDLVKAAMVNSSNDAAFAIAIHLSGSVDAFVAAMNSRAKQLGMKNSHFTNPAGFDERRYAGNISTARDLLLLTEHAIRNPVFNMVARLPQAVLIEQTTRKAYALKTHNKLLDRYPYTVGIKTGYTWKAGCCLIGRAIREQKDVVLVILNAKTDRWSVAAEMFDRAFGITPDTARFALASRGDSSRARIASEVPALRKLKPSAIRRIRNSKRKALLSKAALREKRRGVAHSKTGIKAKQTIKTRQHTPKVQVKKARHPLVSSKVATKKGKKAPLHKSAKKGHSAAKEG